MPINLIERTAELREHLQAISLPSLGPKIREMLLNVDESFEGLVAKLRELNEYVDVTAITEQSSPLKLNLEYWDKIPAGRVAGEQLRALLDENSETLHTLHTGRIDVKSITKFSSDQLQLAKALGDVFEGLTPLWNNMKWFAAKKKTFFLCAPTNRAYIATYMNALKRHKIISAFHVYYPAKGFNPKTDDQESLDALGDDANWVLQPPTRMKDPNWNPQKQLKISYEEFDWSWQNYLSGHWFEAYAYWILDDHLRRIRKDHEIYTCVEYSTAIEGKISASGEFDVLVSTQDKVVMVECKSGKVTDQEIEEITRKASILTQAFRATRVADDKEFIFVLLYSPRSPETDTILEKLKAAGIFSVQPHEVRGFVVDQFSSR